MSERGCQKTIPAAGPSLLLSGLVPRLLIACGVETGRRGRGMHGTRLVSIKGSFVSLYKGRPRVTIFKKSTAKRDEYGRHARARACASASGIDHAVVSRAHSQLSIDRSQRAYNGG